MPPKHRSGTIEVFAPVEKGMPTPAGFAHPCRGEGKLPLMFEWQNKRRMGPRAAEGAGCSAAHTRLGKGWNETAFLEGNLASCLQTLKNLDPLDPHRPASGRLPQETTEIHKM